MKKTINIKISSLLLMVILLSSCNKYLDIVPDNLPTIDMVYNNRTMAERALQTLYRYVPESSNINQNPAIYLGQELWGNDSHPGIIVRGQQSVISPRLNFWQGGNGAKDLYQGIRDCNIFLENISNVPDMDTFEKVRWSAEAKFLKAYFHFYLVRMYGPIPLKRVNIPINATPAEMHVPRDPVDECFEYIVGLLDEAVLDLPPMINDELSELGRITQPIALTLKAYVLVTAASPLFNGNTDYAGFKDQAGRPFFNQEYDPGKWTRARVACEEAIEACHLAGNTLYYYSQSNSQYNVSDFIRTQMNVRNSVTEKWNKEIIWGNTNSMTVNYQQQGHPRGLDPSMINSLGATGRASVPLHILSLFYTENGVPLNEDPSWSAADQFVLRTAKEEDKYKIRVGYTTAGMHFGREPRYYADLGFDGGQWYGQGKFNDQDMWFVSSKLGEPVANISDLSTNFTGVWPKKMVNFENTVTTGSINLQAYPWPEFRLANLYLLYAEAINEDTGPSQDAYDHIDFVRARAGLRGVLVSWADHSIVPNKPLSKEGLREIIHREREIELMFEGQRFWDMRRWKRAMTELNKPFSGWDLGQSTARYYYRERILFMPSFLLRDYLWPVSEAEILANSNTAQNPGW